jgi:RNA polymerase sigma-70 factor (ECF subfamily)
VTVAIDPPASDRWLREALAAAIEWLPKAHRQAVQLMDIEGLSAADAARRMGTTPGVAKLRAHRGRRSLRTQLAAML